MKKTKKKKSKPSSKKKTSSSKSKKSKAKKKVAAKKAAKKPARKVAKKKPAPKKKTVKKPAAKKSPVLKVEKTTVVTATASPMKTPRDEMMMTEKISPPPMEDDGMEPMEDMSSLEPGYGGFDDSVDSESSAEDEEEE